MTGFFFLSRCAQRWCDIIFEWCYDTRPEPVITCRLRAAGVRDVDFLINFPI